MLSRENRAILASFGIFVLALAGVAVLVGTLGVPAGDGPIAALAFAVAIVLPQVYLAWTDDEVAPRTRLGVATVLAGLFALVVVCWREVRVAYRESIGNDDASGNAASRP